MNITDSRNEEPASHNNYNFNNSSTQWSQVTPQYMPWGHTPSSPAAPLVTFTAQAAQENQTVTEPQPGPSHFNYKTFNILKHMKRKAEQDIASSMTKQHITEERMAAHMSRLHISSETPPETAAVTVQENVEVHQQRLYVCEEMRKLQTESVLPSILLGRIERPCMAVMLWQPPPKVPDLLPPALAAVINSASTSSSNNNNNNEEDNNNSSVVDLNDMVMDT